MVRTEELAFLKEMKLPKMYKIRQKFHAPVLESVSLVTKRELLRPEIRASLKRGQRVAIGVGSRGITDLDLIIKAVIGVLQEWGVKPFIVPTMGTHGGADPAGQRKIIADYGISQEKMGVPIKASTDVKKIGNIRGEVPVYFNRLVLEEADAYIPINRIKLHTDFHGENESGIMKMLAIGFGNPKQTSILHGYGVKGLKMIPDVAEKMIEKTKMAFGIGIVENAYDQTAKVKTILPDNLRDEEAGLLKLAKDLFPGFPISKFDLLIVDEIGKNISGSGMDTNILGRIRIKGEKEPETPDIFRVVALDLTPESHGNAIGIGLADYTTDRLFQKIKFTDLRENAVTSSFVERGKIPLPLPSDEKCIKAALTSCWQIKAENAKIIRIKNTLTMAKMYVSESVYEMIKDNESIEFLTDGREFKFDVNGDLF